MVTVGLLPRVVYCEVTSGRALLRLETKGKPVLVISDGVYIDADFPKGEFVPVCFELYLQKEDFLHEGRIRKGTALTNTQGRIIGKALGDFDALLTRKMPSGKIQTYVRGYIPRSAVLESSIPETELDSLISHTNGDVDTAALVPHIVKFKYQSWLSYDEFISYIKFGSDLIGSPGVRSLLVFRTGKLFAIIHPNTLIKSRLFPWRNDVYTVQYFTDSVPLREKFVKGFYFQFKSAG